ncbi:MAG: pilus assembly protein PilM [Patescibacteria group bacterium]
MKLFGPTSQAAESIHKASHTLARWFPTPELILPRAAGIDISDASVKWIVLAPRSDGYCVETYGEEPIPPGTVVNGNVKNVEVLGQSLRNVKKRLGGIECAHSALPEETAYIFEMNVPEGSSRKEIMNMIEFEFEGRVPIGPDAAVFDFDVIPERGVGKEIGVVVFPRELAESYGAAFGAAGINLLSLEVEARSIARAVSKNIPNEPITLLVDFGRARTGFAVLKRGIPIFTSTVEVGGDTVTKALREKLSLSEQDSVTFKNEQGLQSTGNAKSPGLEAVTAAASVLADEVARHYHYWDTRRNDQGERMTPVGQVILVGGSSNLKGLSDYIAGRIQANTTLGNVWQHVCSFEEYIPPINKRASLQYATAIGLALRQYSL